MILLQYNYDGSPAKELQNKTRHSRWATHGSDFLKGPCIASAMTMSLAISSVPGKKPGLLTRCAVLRLLLPLLIYDTMGSDESQRILYQNFATFFAIYLLFF